MQCYEGEALRLQLYAETRFLLPDTVFDPFALDEALEEFKIACFLEYQALESAQRMALARRANQLSPRWEPPVQTRAASGDP